jgi:hypothetical protein
MVFALAIFSLAMFLPFTLNIQAVHAQSTSYSIQHVDHNVEVLYSGHIVIRDTIQTSGQMPDSFQIGVPYKYSSYVLKGIAYDSNGKVLPMTLGVQLQESGYYGASVSFPAGSSQVFTVVFILSSSLLTPTTSGFQLDFPAYPSFVTAAAECNVTLSFPIGATSISINKNDGAINGTNYVKQNLEALTYSPATATFSIDTGYLQIVNIPTLNRQVNINPAGAITCTDNYRLVNNSTGSISSFEINLPASASKVVARDGFGRTLSVALQDSSVTRMANLSLILAMNPCESSMLTIDYSLPSVSPQQSGRFVLNLDLFPYCNYYVDSASVTVAPPEGAKIVTPQLSSIGPSSDLTRNVFQETLSVNRKGISYVDSTIPSEDVLQVTFDYSSLWVALLPTSWMWAVAIVGCVFAAIWMRPKTKASPMIVVPKMTVGLSPENIKEFTDSYEERNKITSEIRSLEARVQRGRMPRRRYKVQRRTLELRLNTLNHNIAKLKDLLRSAGGSYADSVRQLEFAEVELNEVELAINTIEARHATGELPIEGYRKQLTDLERRKSKAETAISGLLLRLRGEI